MFISYHSYKLGERLRERKVRDEEGENNREVLNTVSCLALAWCYSEERGEQKKGEGRRE